jgi:hypothetical protein
MGFFILSTQHHYRRLILLLIMPHVSVVRPSSRKNYSSFYSKSNLNLEFLHPVVCERSDDVGFNPSTQRHYRRLILLLILLHVSVVRPSSSRTIVHFILKAILILGVCVLLYV